MRWGLEAVLGMSGAIDIDCSAKDEGDNAVDNGIDEGNDAVDEYDVLAAIVMGSLLALVTSSPSPTAAFPSVTCSSILATISLFFEFPGSFAPVM